MNQPTTAAALAAANAVPYIGNGTYCYANAAAMLLASHGEPTPPSILEVLSGVGLGAAYRKEAGVMFFSDPNGLPDGGIARAMEILGFAFETWSGEGRDAAPFDRLASALEGGPVMIGPLDMGHLRYHPQWEWLGGADHYVLVTAIGDRQVRIHDPDGLPCVTLPFDELELAWRAERIAYRSNPFRAWHAPRRVESPSDTEIRERAMRWFRERMEGAPRSGEVSGMNWGAAAIRACAADLLAGTAAPQLHGFLVFFALKLGARRALDYANFFDPIDGSLAAAKREQADAFGLAHCAAMRKEWAKLGELLEQLARIETRIRDRLLA
jgi:hypothetical protein